MKTVLFLCTGNYYRSRFAELLFNRLAVDLELGWRATSRGLALERGVNNIGPISQHTIDALRERGICAQEESRFPIAASEADMSAANHIVALKQDEHLPLVKQKFPRSAQQIEFWHIHDLDFATPRDAMAQIDENVRGLILRLISR